MMNFQILFEAGMGVMSQYISSEVDLLEVYKQHLLSGNQSFISWKDGVLDCKKVVGIINTTPPLLKAGGSNN